MSQAREFQVTEENNNRVLVVDDNNCLLEIVCQILLEKKYKVTGVESGETAIEELKIKDFDLVITDFNMGEVNGIEVLRKAKELNPETMVIIMTSNNHIEHYGEALELDACDYLIKPFELSDFLNRVSHCMRKYEGRRAKKEERPTRNQEMITI